MAQYPPEPGSAANAAILLADCRCACDCDRRDMCRVDRRQRVALLAFRYRGMSRSNEAEY